MDAERPVMNIFRFLQKGEAVLRPFRTSVIALILIGTATAVQAQNTLERGQPTQSELAAGASESWTFTAYEGEALSFVVESAGDLDPMLSIGTSGGSELIANDDYNYPESSDALLEAVTFPRTATYTATVTAFGDTAGAYTITMLRGFAEASVSDSFDDQRAWESTGAPLTFQINEDAAELNLNAPDERGIVLRRENAPADLFAQVDVVSVDGSPGWIVGLVTRYQDARTYYAFVVNERGQWRFSVNDTILRDWVSHPAIVPGDTAFTLGMMSSGNGFDFFYDGVLVGRVADAENTIAGGGQIGLLVETGAQINARFDNVVITLPRIVHDEPPQRIVVADSRAIVPQLQRRFLLPGNGEMILTVPESFATSNRAGVYEVPLAGGQTFRNFAIGSMVAWTADAAGTVGCGLLLRSTAERVYTLAYVDQSGGYGLAQRTGDTFEAGLYGEGAPTDANTHHLLVIANEDTLYYYVDGLFVGTLANTAVAGGVGNAVVNFEPVNTACAFTDTWVWRWD